MGAACGSSGEANQWGGPQNTDQEVHVDMLPQSSVSTVEMQANAVGVSTPQIWWAQPLRDGVAIEKRRDMVPMTVMRQPIASPMTIPPTAFALSWNQQSPPGMLSMPVNFLSGFRAVGNVFRVVSMLHDLKPILNDVTW